MSITEKYLNGATHVHETVLLRNPRAERVEFVGDDGVIRECGAKPKIVNGKSVHNGARYQDVVIEPGETVEISFEVANILLTQQCTKCRVRWVFGDEPGPARCVDPKHPRRVVAGLAPFLQFVDRETSEVTPVEVDGNLREAPSPAYEPGDLHARVMARIGGRKS